MKPTNTLIDRYTTLEDIERIQNELSIVEFYTFVQDRRYVAVVHRNGHLPVAYTAETFHEALNGAFQRTR